jgi:hypothetical protein
MKRLMSVNIEMSLLTQLTDMVVVPRRAGMTLQLLASHLKVSSLLRAHAHPLLLGRMP